MLTCICFKMFFYFFLYVFALCVLFTSIVENPWSILFLFTLETRLTVGFRQCFTSCFAYFPLGTIYITFISWDFIFTFSWSDIFFKSNSKMSELLIRIYMLMCSLIHEFFFWTSCYICIKCKYKVFWHKSDLQVYRWTCVTCTVNSSLTWVDVLQYMVSKIFLSPKKMSWVVDK